MRRRGRKPRVKPDEAARLAAIADAHSAAEIATQLARESGEWAQRAHAGEDDAAEVLLAAQRARKAADDAEHAAVLDDAWQASRLAWAAVESAREANALVNRAIAESILAA